MTQLELRKEAFMDELKKETKPFIGLIASYIRRLENEYSIDGEDADIIDMITDFLVDEVNYQITEQENEFKKQREENLKRIA